MNNMIRNGYTQLAYEPFAKSKRLLEKSSSGPSKTIANISLCAGGQKRKDFPAW